jgi:CRP-like cAMP-binding protein
MYERGSPPTGVYCLLDGRVKLAALSADGSERVLDLVLPVRLFGQAAAVLDEPHPVFAQVLCESRLLHVGRERLCEAITRWPEVSAILLRSVAREVYRLIHDLESCCLMTAGRRLIRFLLDEASRGPGSCDSAVVTLHASKALVASTLNLSAETFSRELHELARQGLVEVDRRTVRIPSLVRLSNFAESEEARLAAANE